MQILRDWELVKLINELRIGARNQEGATDTAPAAMYLEAARRSEAHLRASMAELSLPFKLPELRLAGALLS